MLILQDISYIHPNKDLLFEQINFSLQRYEKASLIGNNGSGKSNLLKIIAQELAPSGGRVQLNSKPYYVPQILDSCNELTIAQALGIEAKLNALQAILRGEVTEENYALLNDDWTIEERCREALGHWQLPDFDLSQPMKSLSGGQKTKVFLAGINIHDAELVLLDEPSNHLDHKGREILYGMIQSSKSTMLIVSHDRKLLNLLDRMCEISPEGISCYGGNYDFYRSQKETESQALEQDIQHREKALRKAREKERETLERQQKLDSRGKKKQEKSGTARIMMNTLRNNAENSTSKMKSVHTEKIGHISQELQTLRSSLSGIDQMKFGFGPSTLHKGKMLFEARAINVCFKSRWLWQENLNLQIGSGERVALIGDNGSGKSTLIRIILGKQEPGRGTVYRAAVVAISVDQEYSLINPALKVYEQAQQFNDGALQEHEIKIRLNRFLFGKESWDKPCSALSGGERMRLMLCCLTIGTTSPDMIVLDEPTNNLDIQNIEILTAAINEYEGTLLVVSHDETFLEQVGAGRSVKLDFNIRMASSESGDSFLLNNP